MFIKWVLLFSVGFALSGCAFVDRHGSGLLDQATKPNSCRSEIQREEPDYTTTGSYRCSGGKCHDYGCRSY
ncbi:MAG: hypothetical protein K0U21_00620 [Proteobacteria bacterium]|nr:hypothetical protein [Pseudomonadota bacterium]